MATLTVDAGTPISPTDLTGQLHGVGTGVPAALYARLQPKYWRVGGTASDTSDFLESFPDASTRPIPIVIYSDWFACPHGPPPITTMPSDTDLATWTGDFYSSLDPWIQTNMIVDVVNEPDDTSSSRFWGLSEAQFDHFLYIVAKTIKGIDASPTVYSSSWQLEARSLECAESLTTVWNGGEKI